MTDAHDRFFAQDMVLLNPQDRPKNTMTEDGRADGPASRPALPKSVRYVKIGVGGKWWAASKNNGQLHAGWSTVPRPLLLAADLPAIRELLVKGSSAKAGVTQDVNALTRLLDHPSQHIWITFEGGYMWWCTVRDGITMPEDGQDAAAGHFWLTCDLPWSNSSIGGKLLAIADLPGTVTTTAGFRSTVCVPKAWQTILRILYDEPDPDALAMDRARAGYEAAIETVVKRLGWKDFEQLVDMILLKAGWSRISTLGKTQEGIDLEVENLAVRERAFVQVKSTATQAILNDYVNRFQQRRDLYTRMIFAVHSPAGALTPPADLPVQLWTGPHIAAMVVRLGLGDWVERMLA